MVTAWLVALVNVKRNNRVVVRSCALLLTLLGGVAQSCRSPEAPKQLTPAFYHWKATFAPTTAEKRLLDSLHVRKLYVHFFDVDWDARARRAVPKAFVRFREKPALPVIPVVFITNRTLVDLPASRLGELAQNVSRAIWQIAQKNAVRVGEVQFDCDWTLRTRDRYFRLLTLLNKQVACPLSATIRLHQIKYFRQTGVPPVARGMLMVYNMADWKRPDTRNSIYDPDVAARYVPYVTNYPLPLDVVLPLFRWTVVYRNGRFFTFLNHIDRARLSRLAFLEPQSDSSRFVASRDTSAFGLSIRRGDLFRAEVVTAVNLLTEKTTLLRRVPAPELTFALYHLDSLVLAAYSREELQQLFSSR